MDKVIREDAWEQKRKDILEYQVDVFIMGDDWKGKFDTLSDICQIIYLERTPSISSRGIKTILD